MIPLVLHDGTQIDTDTGKVIRQQEVLPAGYVEVPTHEDAVELVARTRRRISDLPDKPDSLHPVAIILTYHLFGLSDAQIAIATETSENFIKQTIDSEPFQVMKDAIASDVVEGQREAVLGILERGAVTAATTQVAMLTNEDDAIALAASKQILDRTMKDKDNQKRQRMPALNISIVSDDGKSQMNIKMGDG